MAKGNIFVTLYRKIFVGHGLGKYICYTLQKDICWTWPRKIYLLDFTEKYLLDMAKVVYLLPPTPVLAHQRNRPHGGRRRPSHRQV